MPSFANASCTIALVTEPNNLPESPADTTKVMTVESIFSLREAAFFLFSAFRFSIAAARLAKIERFVLLKRTARPFGSKKLRAYPSFTSTWSPSSPRFRTSWLNMTFI
jgi:hypothetical protein